MAYSNCVFCVSFLTLVSVPASARPAAVDHAHGEPCFATYDYQKNPRFFGAPAGGTGGAGGSIRVRASDYACSSGTASFSAAGGNAATIGTGGGGGGGRVLVEAASDACSAQPLSALDANVVATGGLGNDGAENGAAGTLALASALLACADPVGLTVSRDGAAPPSIVKASDGLCVLRASVGSECCDLCICDANGSGDVTATDALITLSAAVGQPVTLQCPVCS